MIKTRVMTHPVVQRIAGDSVVGQFVRGASAAFIIGAASRFITFPINIVLARVLGAEDFGTYIFVLNWMGMLLIAGTLGLDTAVLRFVPSYRSAGEWGLLRGFLRRSTELILLVSVLISLVLAGITLANFDRMGEALAFTFLAAAAALPIAALNQYRMAALRAVGRITWSEGLSYIVAPVVHAIAVVAAFFALGRTLSSAIAMLLAGVVDLVITVVGTVMLNRAMPIEARVAPIVQRTREWLRVAFPLSLVTGMLMALNSVDIIIIGIMLGPTEAGIYAVAANLARFTMFGLVASDIASQPMVSPLYRSGDTAGLRRLVVMIVWSSALLAAAIGLAIIVLQQPLLALFGSEFQAGASVLMILVVGRIINAITGPSGSLLAMTKHQDMNAVILGATVLFNIPTTIVGIWLAGIEGAAIATTISLTLLTVWTWIEVRRRLGINASIFAGIPFRRGGTGEHRA